MKNALLIGFFTDNALIREAYNAMQVELSLLGWGLEGMQPEGGVAAGYEFPVCSCDGIPKRPRSSRFWRALGLLPTLAPNREEKSYAEMQTPDGNPIDLLKCLETLVGFSKSLKDFLSSRKIGFVILNHQFSGFHLIARDVCRDAGVPFVFWHPGFLPGTMSFDKEGQMAESEINSIIAQELPECGAAEEQLGEQYRNWCREQAYLRPGKTATSNPSSVNELLEIKTRFRKILLVIGSNDYRTGMLPRSYRNSHMHSRLIHSSAELYRMAVGQTDGETLVIYKPHPNLSPPTPDIQWDSERSLRLFDVTIRDLLPLATATATLCSSGAYESMLFGLPTAVIGEIPGSRTGICYTLDPRKPDFAETIRQTLNPERTSEMESRFNILVGFLLKKYFFASGTSACPLVATSMRDALARFVPMIQEPHRASL